MSSNDGQKHREPTVIILDPPTFAPPVEMRRTYLERRKSELAALLESAKADSWRPVVTTANHVTGTGAMYGFPAIGDAAENLGNALDSGASNCRELLDAYVELVRGTEL